MNYIFLFAGGVSAFGLVLHLLLGRRPARPDEVSPHSALIQLDADYGRHVTALILLALAVTFAHASRSPSSASFAFALSGLGLAASLLRFILALRHRAPRLDIGEWTALAAASSLGLAERFLSLNMVIAH
jgi:hypothetical protein